MRLVKLSLERKDHLVGRASCEHSWPCSGKRRFEQPGELHPGGTQLDRPRSPAAPKARPRSWWASQPPWLELGCLLGAAALLIRLVLHGPQGAQRRLLCLGETPNARDSEALVGPVAPQGV
jgi:hypothetical protein